MPKYQPPPTYFNDAGLAGESITIDVLYMYYALTIAVLGFVLYYWCMPTIRSYVRRWVLDLDLKHKEDQRLATALATTIRSAADKSELKRRTLAAMAAQQAEGSA